MVDRRHMGRSFSPHPIKGHRILRILVCVCCAGVELVIFVVVFATLLMLHSASCLRSDLALNGFGFCRRLPFDLQMTVYLHKMCLCALCRYVLLRVFHVYIYSMTVYVYDILCWCLRVAALKRGRMFHLIQGQYLHERSYKQLSQPEWEWTQGTSVLQ